MEEIEGIEYEGETPQEINIIHLPIELNKKVYNLKIDYKEDKITFELIDIEQLPFVKYIRIMNFNEIKELNQLFSLLKTYNDFYDYLKLLSKDKKIKIKKSKDKILIILIIDILSKKAEITIDLFPEKKNPKNKFELKLDEKNKEIENLKKSIKECPNEIKDLKEKNKKSEKSYEYTLFMKVMVFKFFILFITLLLLFVLIFKQKNEESIKINGKRKNRRKFVKIIKNVENGIKRINYSNKIINIIDAEYSDIFFSSPIPNIFLNPISRIIYGLYNMVFIKFIH